MIMCSCKNETKKEEYVGPEKIETKEETKEEIKEFIIDTINMSDANKWKLKNINIDSTKQGVDGSVINRLETNTSSYLMSNFTNIEAESNYRVTIYAKRSSNNFLGLRITGIYPSRADAIFDLDQGKVVGTSAIGDFSDESARIELIMAHKGPVLNNGK